jgi:hypothetical protein
MELKLKHDDTKLIALTILERKYLKKGADIPHPFLAELSHARNNSFLFKSLPEKDFDNFASDIFSSNIEIKELVKYYFLKFNTDSVRKIKIYTSDGEIKTDFHDNFITIYSQRKDAFCVYYHKRFKQFSLADESHYLDIIQEFIEFCNKGYEMTKGDRPDEGHIFKANGKKMYPICFYKDDSSICLGSLSIFGFHFFGFVYWFFREDNRNKVFDYITKKTK